MSIPLLLFAGCCIGLADDTVRLENLKVALPKSISGIEFEERKDFDNEELGYGVAYGNRRCHVNLYVYDHGQKKIPLGKEGAVIDSEMKSALADIAAAEKDGVFTNVVRLPDELPLPMPAKARFAGAGFTFDLRGKPCRSFVLLTGRSNKFVKIRFTQYVVNGRTNDDELAGFLEAVAKCLE